MTTTLPLPVPNTSAEFDGHAKSLPKIKAPFRLTRMSDSDKPPWFWVWSRRGKRWIVNQELRFYPDSKPIGCGRSGT
jgi:hypothetical protein